MCEIAEITSSIESIVVSICAVTSVALAIYGVNSWLREFKGKRDTELCEEVLERFYRAQEAIRWMRSPLVLASELKRDEKGGLATSEEGYAAQNAQVLFDRYEKHQELFGAIYALRYRFMARFGKEHAEPFNELHAALNRLFSSARMLASLWKRSAGHFRTDEQWQAHWKKIESQEAIFWGLGDESDAFDQELAGIVSKIESVCRKRIAS